uniref:Uncharacterized protein n=1 Tax=Acrobeloides nanus TaxID=290746 RepID=A0A914BYD1_9BILA
MSGFFLWSFLFTCTPLIMVRIGTILSMLSGVLLSLPYWVGWEEKNAEDFSRFLLCLIVGRALLCFAGTINYTYGVAYYFGNSRDTASHHQHYMLGSLVYAELIAEFFAIIPLILTVKLNFFKKYGDRGISDNTVTPTRQASYKERVKTIYENYTTEFKLAIRQKDFFHRLLLCIAVVVTARIPFLLWNIESTYILKTILQIDEYRLVDLMIKSAVISCVFAICSAWFFAIGFQMHTKLCWVIIFALIFDLMFIYPFNEILNLNSEDFEDIVIGEAIIYAVLREALYEIMPNLFKRRSQVIAGCAFTFGLYHFLWFLVNENFFGLISLGDIFKDEFSFSEYVYYIVIIASKITFITLILLLYKWKRWHGFLVVSLLQA